MSCRSLVNVPLVVGGGPRLRAFVLEEVAAHPRDVTALAAARFGVTRQAVHAQVRRLVREGLLVAEGRTRARRYALAVLGEAKLDFPGASAVAEDAVWREHVEPVLAGVAAETLEACQDGFCEALRNALDHAGAARVSVRVVRTAARIEMSVRDDGRGIRAETALEIAKGTAGAGLLRIARLADVLAVFSGHHTLRCEVTEQGEAWSLATHAGRVRGTTIGMSLRLGAGSVLRPDAGGVLRPVPARPGEARVPVRLAILGSESLLSRSQAARVFARLERFDRIVLDFTGVETIGAAFADEAFRVFAAAHPSIALEWVGASQPVEAAIAGARTRASAAATR